MTVAHDEAIREAVDVAWRGNMATSESLLEHLARSDPQSTAAQVALGDVRYAMGRYGDAMDAYLAALDLEPTSHAGRIGVALSLARRPALVDRLERTLVSSLLGDEAVDPALLARAVALLMRDAPDRGPDRAADPLADPLLPVLLRRAINTDVGLERLLVEHRRQLCLSSASDPDEGSQPDELARALAAQGQLNEFVWPVSAEEEASLPDAPAWVRDMYGPQTRDDDLIRRAAGIPALMPIGDAVSHAVADQYEEHPYPRWTCLPPHGREDLRTYLTRLTEGRWRPGECLQRPRMLVAGCGTGREMLTAASAWQPSEVVGVDLSRTSLGFAHRMAERLGIRVQLFHGDLLSLADWPRRFDVIVCTGVLHHLGDPIAGWRTLRGLLSPDGVMLVGLYSAIARRGVLAAQAEVRRRGLVPTASGIRAAREVAWTMPEAQACLDLSDFYYSSGCRDLLLHAHEQEFTIPALQAALADLGLEFLGFDIEGAERHRFATLFGRGDDLALWDAYERLFPSTFLGMYQFWCRASTS